MIIELQTDGKSRIVVNDRIYQGSSNVTDLFVISHDMNAAIKVAFILPSGIATNHYPMAFAGRRTNSSLWRLRLLNSVTAEAGIVKIALDALSTDENGMSHRTSSLCEFEVLESVDPTEAPAIDDPELYDLLVNYYGKLASSVDKLEQIIPIIGITADPLSGTGEKTYSDGTKEKIQFHDGGGKRGVFAMAVENGNLILHTKQLDDVVFELNEDGELIGTINNDIII